MAKNSINTPTQVRHRFIRIVSHVSLGLLLIVSLFSCSSQQLPVPGYQFQVIDAQQKPILAATVSLRWSDEPRPFSVAQTDNQGIVTGRFLPQSSPKNWSRELVVIATESTFDYDTDSTQDTGTTLTITVQQDQRIEKTIQINPPQ